MVVVSIYIPTFVLGTLPPRRKVLWGERCFRGYQSGQVTTISGTYNNIISIITVFQCDNVIVYT